MNDVYNTVYNCETCTDTCKPLKRKTTIKSAPRIKTDCMYGIGYRRLTVASKMRSSVHPSDDELVLGNNKSDPRQNRRLCKLQIYSSISITFHAVSSIISQRRTALNLSVIFCKINRAPRTKASHDKSAWSPDDWESRKIKRNGSRSSTIFRHRTPR